MEGKRTGSSEVSFSCPICDDDVAIADSYSLGDGHRFCTSCWRDYLSSAVSNGRTVLSTPCPAYQCVELCHPSTFKLLCPPPDYARYSSYALRSYVEDNVNMRWCTSPGCPYALHAFHRGLQSVSCPLGHSFCFQCQEEAHEPCSCAQLQAWKEKNALESDNAHWIIANTKRCPQCTVRIEKNQGCNHITCRACKFEYAPAAHTFSQTAHPLCTPATDLYGVVRVSMCRWCWVCCGSWVDHGNHTGGFYKCNKWDPKQAGKQNKWKVEGAAADAAAERKEGSGAEKEREKEKSAEALKQEKDAELNRYLFYYQRYHNHAESAKFASQLRRETDKKMQLIAAGQHHHTASPLPHSSSSHSSRSSSSTSAPHGEALLIDFAFLQHATDVILRCRHVLKYTYVFAYFLVGDEREGERNLMEFLQQQLEKSVEALSELTEQRVEVLGRKDEKSKIVNYTRVTDKFRENLLQGVRNGLTG